MNEADEVEGRHARRDLLSSALLLALLFAAVLVGGLHWLALRRWRRLRARLTPRAAKHAR